MPNSFKQPLGKLRPFTKKVLFLTSTGFKIPRKIMLVTLLNLSSTIVHASAFDRAIIDKIILTVDEAIEIAESKTNGFAVGASLKTIEHTLAWEVLFQEINGRKKYLLIESSTGLVLNSSLN